MRIEKRSMNWLPKPGAFAYAQAQAQKRRANHDSFISTQSNLAGNLIGTTTAQTEGVAELAMKAAVKRITSKKA